MSECKEHAWSEWFPGGIAEYAEGRYPICSRQCFRCLTIETIYREDEK